MSGSETGLLLMDKNRVGFLSSARESSIKTFKVGGLKSNIPDSGALSSNNFPNDIKRIELGKGGRGSHSAIQ